jgi:hypothetical protein
VRSVPARISSLKTSLCVSNYSLSTQTTSPPTHRIAEAVLSSVAKAVVPMERASYSGDAENRRRLASCRIPAVLEVAFEG